MVDIRKLTESGVLSALFIIVGMFFISTGIGYSIFLDIGVPIFITLVYLRSDMKYTLMFSITSFIIVTFIFANAAVGISMIQGLLIGLICGFLIERKSYLYDDLLYASMLSGLVLIFVDIFFSGILGYSFISEAKEYLVYFPYDDNIKEVIFYILIAALPLGTIIMTYIGSLLIAKKIRILNDNGLKKFIFVKKYKRFGTLQYCSEKTTYLSVIYIVIMKLIGKDNILFRFTYLKTILICTKYIAIYFLIKDAYTIICSFVYKASHSRGILALSQVIIFYLLVSYFVATAISLVLFSIIMDKKFSIRKSSEFILNNINLKAELC